MARFIIVLLLGILTTCPADAAIVTWRFGGELTAVTDHGGLPANVTTGDLFTMLVSFDTDVPEGGGLNPSEWLAFYKNPVRDIQIFVAGQPLLDVGPHYGHPHPEYSNIQIEDDSETYGGFLDSWGVQADGGYALPGPWWDMYAFVLSQEFNSAPDLVESKQLDAPPPELGASNRFQFTGHSLYSIQGDLTEVTAVPLPAVGWLLAPAFAVLGRFRHRRVSSN